MAVLIIALLAPESIYPFIFSSLSPYFILFYIILYYYINCCKAVHAQVEEPAIVDWHVKASSVWLQMEMVMEMVMVMEMEMEIIMEVKVRVPMLMEMLLKAHMVLVSFFPLSLFAYLFCLFAFCKLARLRFSLVYIS